MLKKILAPFLVALLVPLLWIVANGRWSSSTWLLPKSMNGDWLEVAARAKIASEHPTLFSSPYNDIARLGAPWHADWSLYPTPDRPAFFIAGLLSRHTTPWAAINFVEIVFYILSAVSFFLCARYLRWTMAWSAAGAVAFAFCTFNIRYAFTLSLGATFAWPPFLILCHWISRRAPTIGNAKGWTILAGALGMAFGTGNPYFTFLAVQFALFAFIAQWFGSRQSNRLKAGLVLIAAMGISFGLAHLDYFKAFGSHDDSLTLERNYGGSEVYALKPIELFVPPPDHRIRKFAWLGQVLANESLVHSTEPWSAYLGVVGGTGLVILVAFAVIRTASPRRRIKPPIAALGAAWIFIFSAVGGVNSMLSLAGIDQFRATNRYSVVLEALALLFLLGWLQRKFSRRPLLSNVAAVLIGLVAIMDQIPRPPGHSHYRSIQNQMTIDQETASAVEQAAGGKAVVFQLPATPFPEAGPVGRFPDYDHLRLFLNSSSARFSFGELRGSIPYRWSTHTAAMPADKLVTTLEVTGFNTLIIDRRAYADDAKLLIDSLLSLRLTAIPLPMTPHLAAFRLNPQASPVLPNATSPEFYPTWSSATTNDGVPQSFISIHAVRGWFLFEKIEGNPGRFAGDKAELSVVNAHPNATQITLQFQLTAWADGKITIVRNKQVLWSGNLAKLTPKSAELNLSLQPGPNDFEWQFEGELTRVMGDRRKLGFALTNLSITPSP